MDKELEKRMIAACERILQDQVETLEKLIDEKERLKAELAKVEAENAKRRAERLAISQQDKQC